MEHNGESTVSFFIPEAFQRLNLNQMKWNELKRNVSRWSDCIDLKVILYEKNNQSR